MILRYRKYTLNVDVFISLLFRTNDVIPSYKQSNDVIVINVLGFVSYLSNMHIVKKPSLPIILNLKFTMSIVINVGFYLWPKDFTVKMTQQ